MGNRALSKKKQNYFSYGCYRVIRWLVWLFYPKMKVTGTEHLPEEACIIVGNHGQMNGPICAELYIPKKRAIWCAYHLSPLDFLLTIKNSHKRILIVFKHTRVRILIIFKSTHKRTFAF